MSRPPLPPFTEETAIEKVRLAEDGWNSRDAAKVALAYTLDTKWRNRVEFANSRDEAQALLTRKWNKEHEYRLIKELWAFTGNRIAVRIKFPILVAIGTEPMAAVIAIFIRIADGDAVAGERPEFLDQSIVQFLGPFAREETFGFFAVVGKFGAVTPFGVEGVGQ